jgi:hypothetical protein
LTESSQAGGGVDPLAADEHPVPLDVAVGVRELFMMMVVVGSEHVFVVVLPA